MGWLLCFGGFSAVSDLLEHRHEALEKNNLALASLIYFTIKSEYKGGGSRKLYREIMNFYHAILDKRSREHL